MSIPPKHPCPFNKWVECGPYDENGRRVERNCNACGWNPEVAEARLEKVRKALQEEKTPQQ